MKQVTIVALIAGRQALGKWFTVDLDNLKVLDDDAEDNEEGCIDADMAVVVQRLSADASVLVDSSEATEFVCWIGGLERKEEGRSAFVDYLDSISTDGTDWGNVFDLIVNCKEESFVPIDFD